MPATTIAALLAKADQVLKESQELAADSAEKMVKTRAGDKRLPAHGQLKVPPTPISVPHRIQAVERPKPEAQEATKRKAAKKR